MRPFGTGTAGNACRFKALYGTCLQSLISLVAQMSTGAWAVSEHAVKLREEQGSQSLEASVTGVDGKVKQDATQEGISPQGCPPLEARALCLARLTFGVLRILFSPRPDRRGQ